jgi:hypothetical protein
VGRASSSPFPLPPVGVAEELFRHRVIRMLVRRGRLNEDAAAGLLSWRHSGFSVRHAIRVEPDDTAGVERLCRYLVHPPIALGRLTYDGVRASDRGRRVHPVSGADSLTLDPLEMLARLCQHIPPPGFHLTQLYGVYANRTGVHRLAWEPRQGRGHPRATASRTPRRRRSASPIDGLPRVPSSTRHRVPDYEGTSRSIRSLAARSRRHPTRNRF